MVMHAPRKRRLAYKGNYGGVSISFVAALVGCSDQSEVRRRLIEFYATQEYRSRQADPAALGEFIVSFIQARKYDELRECTPLNF
jgi:hypothetical protein